MHWKTLRNMKTAATDLVARVTSVEEIDSVLGSSKDIRTILRKFPYYKRFIEDCTPHRPCDEGCMHYVETLMLAGKRVSILWA